MVLFGILGLCSCEKNAEEPELSDVWVAKAKLSETYRNYASGFSVGGKAYVGLGRIRYADLLKDWWEYDPANDSWSQKGDFPGRWFRDGIKVATKTKGYVGLGVYRESLPDGSVKSEPSKDIWEYDPISDKWSVVSQFPGKASVRAASFAIGDKLYIAAGYEPGVTLTVDDNCNYFDKEVWEFDTKNKSWTQRKNIPTPTDGCYQPTNRAYGLSSEENGYLVFGIASGSLSQLWKYNHKNDSWSKEPSTVGFQPISMFGFVINQHVYMGEVDTWLFKGYDLISQVDENNYVANFPGQGFNGVSFVINKKGYVFANTGELWEYIP